MSPREAAEATGVHKLTILKWIRSGKLPADRIKTSNGDGYDIRPEDLTAALQLPRRKKDPAPVPVQGSVQASIDALRLVIEDQARTIERREAESAYRDEQQTAEIRDLRHQVQQLQEYIRALPAPQPEPEAKPTLWQRLTGRKD